MLLYDFTAAPAPRRTRIFAREKGLNIPTRQVNLREGEQFIPEFVSKNADCTVPVLQLDDGTCISGVMPICRYLETLAAEPLLFGGDAHERAVTDMWQERAEHGYQALIAWYRNSFPGLKGRAVAGKHAFDQIPALAERGQRQWDLFIENVEARLTDQPFIAGASFSVADITVWTSVEFVRSRLDYVLPSEATAAQRWHEKLSARPSADA